MKSLIEVINEGLFSKKKNNPLNLPDKMPKKYVDFFEKYFQKVRDDVKDEIDDSDIAIINQETILVSDPKRYSSYPTFGSPTEVGDAVAKAGFDVVAHATNHTNDKGVSGIPLQ